MDSKEIRITELGEDGFRFRLTEECPEPEQFRICFYDMKKAGYRKVEIRKFEMNAVAGTLEAEERCVQENDGSFFREYSVRVEQKDYCVGLEAEYFAREKGGIMIGNIYDICQKEEKIQVAGEEKEPAELLAHFLRGILKFLGIQDIVKNPRCLCITSPELSTLQVRNYQKACSLAGFSREKYMLMDYGESFYYYALGQKRETWNRSVGWYAFAGDNGIFARHACVPGGHCRK